MDQLLYGFCKPKMLVEFLLHSHGNHIDHTMLGIKSSKDIVNPWDLQDEANNHVRKFFRDLVVMENVHV
jgi:hypothetical protein